MAERPSITRARSLWYWMFPRSRATASGSASPDFAISSTCARSRFQTLGK
jgi:hypothetical protein